MEEGNIILISVNHINQKIEINPFSKSKADINYLKQDESIPGGRAVTYITNTLFKLETGAKLEEDKEFGIKGFYLNGIVVKSRNAEAGRVFKMVYNQNEGIDNILTNYVFMKEQKRISGGGRSYYLDTLPDIKFSQRDFKTKYLENEELRNEFDKELFKEMDNILEKDGLLNIKKVPVVENKEELLADGERYKEIHEGLFLDTELDILYHLEDDKVFGTSNVVKDRTEFTSNKEKYKEIEDRLYQDIDNGIYYQLDDDDNVNIVEVEE